MNLKSELQFNKNGFNYCLYKNDKIVWEKFVAYQAICVIKNVFILNSRDYWWNVEEDFNSVNYESKIYKVPAFDVILINNGKWNEPLRIYDEQMIKHINKYQHIEKSELKSFKDRLKYIINNGYQINSNLNNWIDDDSNIQLQIDQTKNLRQKLIDKFNNWCSSNQKNK